MSGGFVLMRAAGACCRNVHVISCAMISALLPAAAWAYNPIVGDFSKADPLDVRVMAYNTAGRFISTSSADASFNRILTAIQPDVICFEEIASGVSTSQIASRMNSIMPIGGAGWQVHFGILAGTRNAIISRYPLSMTRTDTVPASSTRGVTIALVDLPNASYPLDLYLLGVHLKCCGNAGGSEDASRQRSADAIANWLGDARGVARPAGNNVVLPLNTPMMVLGDFNLVGGPQPENTLVTGNIQDEATFGPDVTGDWDASFVTDLAPADPFTGAIITWQGNGSFPPSRLDRMIFTDSAVVVANSFVLNTSTMPPAALSAAGLLAGDTQTQVTSDHLPIVADLRMAACTDSDGDGICDDQDGCPNDPAKGSPGVCGCGVSDVDSDNDGAPDCIDACPGDPLKTVPGRCGCGAPDTPADGDINDDGRVDGLDLMQFADAVLSQDADTQTICHGDFDGDGQVSVADVPGMSNALILAP
ncbi:MAG: hypothetical protein KF841_11380 [Phycisphaerae bacterium]|nr:hypothetical protein [Phycisphaerae bacterium]